MIDQIKDYWVLIVGFFSLSMWLGKITQMVLDLRASKFVKKEDCKEIHGQCSMSQTRQFGDGQREFAEIKQLIKEEREERLADRRVSEEHHQQVMNKLVEMAGKQ